MTRNNASYWYGFEAIGTVRQLVNAQSQVTDSYAFDAWGNELTSPQSQVSNPFRYVGKHGYYLDTESALMLLGVRYYQAGLGRFMTIDPLKITNNWYVYTSNRPTVLIDPNGKITIIPTICATACACAGLGLVAIVGGCMAGCHDARAENFWGCVGQCIIDTANDMFMQGNIPPGYATCLVGCGLCLIKNIRPIRPIVITIFCFLWAEYVCHYLVITNGGPWWCRFPYGPAWMECVRIHTIVCMYHYGVR